GMGRWTSMAPSAIDWVGEFDGAIATLARQAMVDGFDQGSLSMERRWKINHLTTHGDARADRSVPDLGQCVCPFAVRRVTLGGPTASCWTPQSDRMMIRRCGPPVACPWSSPSLSRPGNASRAPSFP